MIEVGTIVEAQHAWRAAARAQGDADRAAEEALGGMKRCLTTLLTNLADIGYPNVPGIIPPEPGISSRLRRLEEAIGGGVPPILAAFWRVVGGVSLVDLDRYGHVKFWEAHGVTGPDGYCDGVHVDACGSMWLESTLQDFIERAGDPELSPEGPYLLSLSPDGYHKDNISGGEPYGVEAGGGWLGPWQNFSWTGARRPASAPPEPCDLLGYLRTSLLECAGFPALLGAPAFEPVRERLLRNIEVF